MIEYYKIIFIILIFSILSNGIIFFNYTDKISIKENKTLATFPFKLPFHEEFPKEFDRYINDRIGLKNSAVALHNYIYNKLPLSDIINENVNAIKGIDNWLYINMINDDYIHYSGLINYDDTQYNKLKEILIQIDEYCKKNNIVFYFMMPPTKSILYPEYYPTFVNKLRKQSNYELINNFILNNTNINYVNIYEILKKEKSNYQLFYKEDTHWNTVGAYFAYNSLAKLIKKDFPNFKIIEFNQLHRCDKVSEKFTDLKKIIDYPYNYPATNEFCLNNPINKDVLSKSEHRKSLGHTVIPSPYKPNNLKVMIFHDSYFLAMQDYIENSFSEVLSARIYNTSPLAFTEKIEQFKPDIIIWEHLWTYIENAMYGYITYQENGNYNNPYGLDKLKNTTN